MQIHAIQALPRPGVKRTKAQFFPGDIVLSKSSGQRVRVLCMSDCGRWFEGVYIGQAGRLPASPRDRYTYNAWRASNFDRETAQ